jgi:hypothetical protein
VYGFIGLWHFRNHRVNGNNKFSTVTELAPSYREDIIEKDAIKGVLPPALYYLNVFSRSIISLMTDPGSLKDLNSHILKRIGKVIAYPWVVFWLIGFIVGVSRIKKNDIHLQFLLLVVLYFTAASIGGFLFGVSSRARIPMVPFIAILSAYGWSRLTQTKEKGCKR